jgi:hypothetical protein
MNAETAISGRAVAKLSSGAPVVGIVPSTIEEVFRLGELIAQSGLAPNGIKTPQAITVVLLKGLEIGMPPMAAMECFGVINGKACIYGDGIPALLWSRGFDIEETEAAGEGEARKATCAVTRPNGKKVTRSFSVKQAMEAQLWGKNVWKQYPDRMLAMRARAFAARDAASDVLKGIPLFEEQADITIGRDEYSEVKIAPKKMPAELPDIPDEPDNKPDTSANGAAAKAQQPLASEASTQPDKRPTKSDREFMDALDAVYATANDIDALNEHMTANDLEIEERGLEQACAEIYRRHMGRIYEQK